MRLSRFALPLVALAVVLAGAVPAAAESGEVRVSPLALEVDGETARGLLFEPEGMIEPERLIVFGHGHGETASSFTDVLTDLVAATGVPAVAMDYRGPDGHWNVGTGADDTVAATRWFRERHPSVERTVLWGWSMGGMVSGVAAARAPELFDTWVASFPAVNAAGAWALFAALGLDDREELEAEVGCSFPECPERYVDRSPSLLAQAMRLDRAILLHAVGDTVSPYEQSREMQAALLGAGIPVSFYSFLTRPGTGAPAFHGHGRGPVADEAFRVVQRVLAGTEPDTAANQEYLVDGRTGIDTRPGAR